MSEVKPLKVVRITGVVKELEQMVGSRWPQCDPDQTVQQQLAKGEDPSRDRLAVALGERIGDSVLPEDVCQAGEWVFHRFDPRGTEVDCYPLPLAQCAEPWDAIPIVASPFNPHLASLPGTLAKLDKGWKEFMAEDGDVDAPDEYNREKEVEPHE